MQDGRALTRLSVLMLGSLGLIVLWQAMPLFDRSESAQNAARAVPRTIADRGPLDAAESATIRLFEAVRESVAFISTTELVRDVWTRNVFSVPRGTGSGFLWDDAGHVVTNFHVLQGASEARVRLANGRDYAAELVGASPEHDIAVLRIRVGQNPLPPVAIGTSADLKVGQKVFAIGNPFGLDWTLTTGIVSALDRSLPTATGGTIEHLIQTDAPINPGNSGGPLVDSAGRLIGMNTAIYSPSGTWSGIGFAVPVDTVNRVVPQLVSRGRYIRPTLGIQVDEGINEQLKALLGIEGVAILRIEDGSAAAAAGLRAARISREGRIVPGDVIVAIEGRRVDSVGQLMAHLDEFSVGEQVKLEIVREGRRVTQRVTLQPGV
jgi:S1-C subfamily serine protease